MFQKALQLRFIFVSGKSHYTFMNLPYGKWKVRFFSSILPPNTNGFRRPFVNKSFTYFALLQWTGLQYHGILCFQLYWEVWLQWKSIFFLDKVGKILNKVWPKLTGFGSLKLQQTFGYLGHFTKIHWSKGLKQNYGQCTLRAKKCQNLWQKNQHKKYS